MNNVFDKHFGPLQQSNPTPSSTPPTSSDPLAKKKRIQKKKKAQTQTLRVTIQDFDHKQEVEHATENEASKHLVFSLPGAMGLALK